MSSISDIDLKLSQLNGIDIRETSIEKIHGYYKAKKFTCKELVEYYLKRIEKLNPYLNTVIEVNKEAIKKAEELDQLFNEKGMVGSLFGIPILAKDNIATYDTMQTTCGSMALYDVKPKEDATVVKLIRAENAIILGKVNMTEFAGFRDEIDPLGWSARGGQTCNPYVLSKHASGSSSGSAASVAANLAVVSLGTETDGSITAPCSTCSLVGLKPTVGLASRAGIIPLSHNQDSVGIISRNVEDNVRVLSVFYNHTDPRDEKTSICSNEIVSLSLYNRNQFQFKIAFVQKPYFELEAKVKNSVSSFHDLIQKLTQMSNVILTPNAEMDIHLFSLYKQNKVFEYEFKHYLNQYLKNEVTYLKDEKIDSLDKIISFNEEHHELELSEYGQSHLINSNNTEGMTSEEYIKCYEENKLGATEAIETLMEKCDCDILMGPAEPDAMFFTSAAIAGYPIIAMPLDFYPDGEPFGVAFIARPANEVALLALGKLVEDLTKARKAPKFMD